jgi:hypothetical protein
MRQSLRRSCETCARAKHSCDLRTPRCSRCVKRKVPCVYVNEPGAYGAAVAAQGPRRSSPGSESLGCLTNTTLASLDPFESYPQTRLPREQVQRLIHRCM